MVISKVDSIYEAGNNVRFTTSIVKSDVIVVRDNATDSIESGIIIKTTGDSITYMTDKRTVFMTVDEFENQKQRSIVAIFDDGDAVPWVDCFERFKTVPFFKVGKLYKGDLISFYSVDSDGTFYGVLAQASREKLQIDLVYKVDDSGDHSSVMGESYIIYSSDIEDGSVNILDYVGR